MIDKFTLLLQTITLQAIFSFITEIQVYYHNGHYAGVPESVSQSTSCKSLHGYLLYYFYINIYINTYKALLFYIHIYI